MHGGFRTQTIRAAQSTDLLPSEEVRCAQRAELEALVPVLVVLANDRP